MASNWTKKKVKELGGSGLCGCKDDVGKNVLLREPYQGCDMGTIIAFGGPANGDPAGAWYAIELFDKATGKMYRPDGRLVPTHVDFREEELICVENPAYADTWGADTPQCKINYELLQ